MSYLVPLATAYLGVLAGLRVWQWFADLLTDW